MTPVLCKWILLLSFSKILMSSKLWKRRVLKTHTQQQQNKSAPGMLLSKPGPGLNLIEPCINSNIEIQIPPEWKLRLFH